MVSAFREKLFGRSSSTYFWKYYYTSLVFYGRVLLIVFILIIYGSSDDVLLTIYLILLAAFQTSLCIGEAVAAFISSRGTMTNSAPRGGLPVAMYFQACLIALVFVWAVVGVVLSYGPCIYCVLARAALLLSYATMAWNVLVTLGVAFSLRIVKADMFGLLTGNIKKYNWLINSPRETHGRRVSRVSKGSLAQHLRMKTWQWKLKFLFNCLKLDDEKRDMVHSELSDALIELFSQSDSNDYVSSDVAAGLKLIAMAEEVCACLSGLKRALPCTLYIQFYAMLPMHHVPCTDS